MVMSWGINVFKMFIWGGISSDILSQIEGVTATRYFSPLLGKIELASFSCIKTISAP